MKHRHGNSPAHQWQRAHGDAVVLAAMKLCGLPQHMIDQYLSRPLRERYNKHEAVLAVVSALGVKVPLDPSWLSWRVLRYYMKEAANERQTAP